MIVVRADRRCERSALPMWLSLDGRIFFSDLAFADLLRAIEFGLLTPLDGTLSSFAAFLNSTGLHETMCRIVVLVRRGSIAFAFVLRHRIATSRACLLINNVRYI